MEEKLSEQDSILLNSLINPDKTEDNKYVWDVEIQKQILGMLLQDRYFLIQATDLVKPTYFVEDVHRRICDKLFKHFGEYKTIPSKIHMELLIKEDIKSDNPILNYYLAEIESIYDTYEPGFEHREFILDKITEFAKVQATREAVATMIDVLKKNPPNRWSTIRDIWQTALQVERNVDLGLYYFETLEERYRRMEEISKNNEKFITGITNIDANIDGGLSRGEIGAFAGASGSGKSVCLTMVAHRNMMRGKKVVYISLEMNEDKVAQRFDAMFANIGISDLYKHKKETIDQIKLKQEHIVEHYFVDQEDKRQLVIKQFAASTADANTVRAYLTQLATYGFHPDMIIVDYVGEFRDYPGMKTYESRERHVRELRSIAVEYDICIFTAMQLNRGARELMRTDNGFVDDDNLADSAGQVRPLDALWVICQNEQQKKANVGHIFVAKHRNGRSRFSVYFRQCPNTLVLFEISEQLFKMQMSKNEEKIIEGVEIKDLIVNSKSFKPNARNLTEE